jgi:hypothetical protein
MCCSCLCPSCTAQARKVCLESNEAHLGPDRRCSLFESQAIVARARGVVTVVSMFLIASVQLVKQRGAQNLLFAIVHKTAFALLPQTSLSVELCVTLLGILMLIHCLHNLGS